MSGAVAEATRQISIVGGVPLERFGGPAVRLAPAELRSMLNVRGRCENPGFLAAVEEALGVPVPEAANCWNGDERLAIVWLGPDEWLVMGPDGQAADLESRLRRAAGDDHWLSVVDVSHSYTGFTLSGPAARDVLAKGCPLDLHPRVFEPGDCAQSLLAKTGVLLIHARGGDTIEIWVRNSFARYTAAWLADAMAEFGDSS